jgi:D-sedoheptulose 7-phosphate isomerase
MTRPRDFEQLARLRVEESVAVTQALFRDRQLIGLVVQVAHDLIAALRAGRRVFLFGNGGSAADAQHIAAEFVVKYKLERRGLPVYALTVNPSSLTAIGNDYGFEAVFARQLEALGSPGDVAGGISTSGNSTNVLRAVEAAKRKGLATFGLTGRDGGQLKNLVDRCICVPSDDTPRVQEAHILVGHLLSEIAELELSGG